VYPAPDQALEGAVPAFTCRVGEDRDGDGKPERHVTLKQPIFHIVEMLARMGDEFFVLPELKQGHDTISGLASRGADEIRILLYSHNEEDAQSRSDRVTRVSMTLSNLPWEKA